MARNHWLLAVMEEYASTAEKMIRGWDPAAFTCRLVAQLSKGEAGPPRPERDVLRDAWTHAGRRGKKRIEAFDLVSVLLREAGQLVDEFEILEGTRETEIFDASGAPCPPYVPRAKNPTPTLDSLGTDLTQEALAGRIVEATGRDEEIRLVMETLCRRTKRNPVLLGPGGVGKTAIAEGLALLVVQGRVPQVLRNIRLVSLSLNATIADTKYIGTLQKKMEAVLKEARQDGIVLFIDEVHQIVAGAGETEIHSIGTCLKPALARGDVAIIAATTDDEYRNFIEKDTALERRFQPIAVHQLSVDKTREVLRSHSGHIRKIQAVEIPDAALERLLSYSERFLRNRSFPDKAIDLLEQCVANAVLDGQSEITLEGVARVVSRIVGMPMEPAEVGMRLKAMRERISRLSLLADEDGDALYRRLTLALTGMNLQPHRPNAVVLMAGDAADAGPLLAETVAESFFGRKDRLVAIDCGRYQSPSDTTAFLGMAPGYHGHRDAVPLHRLKIAPWSAVLFENIDAAHPAILGTLTRALQTGFFTDGSGKRIFLSDAVVIATAMRGAGMRGSLGFHGAEGSGVRRMEAVRERLGKEFLSACHLVCTEKAPGFEHAGAFRMEGALTDFALRAGRMGISLRWEPAVPEYLAKEISSGNGCRTPEQVVEEQVAMLLMEGGPEGFAGKAVRLTVDETGIRLDELQERMTGCQAISFISGSIPIIPSTAS